MARTRRKRRNAARNRILFAFLLLAAAVLTAAAWRLFGWVSPSQVQQNLPGYVTQDLLDLNEWSRPGEELRRVSGIVLHYVGNPGTSAQANRNYFNSLADGELETYASSHFIVGLEGEVLQCVPLDEIAYASNSRNGDTVSIEVCHPDEGGEFSPAAYRRAVELTAWLCRAFRLSPETEVIRHYDVTGKECPRYYVEHPEAWARLLADVAAEMEAQAAEGDG